ncbi:hypothetical protein BH787_gp14 [Gordonia phage GMA4]|uniref:hypothetical protein n=1 Tax=Gordonia phage GMA4 TaxID=1647471 RepID=UPI0006BD0C29|nr:hypothetical protein BH787_gp14 [Gordonia phage GMA4]AKJ72334.1 hypothetical protein GMA4_59 [Gordonia phage GMA4]
MTATERHACPDCGASHQRRQPKNPARSMAANTDLKPGRCHTCKQPVIRARIEGIDRVLDAQPINEIALITYRHVGRRTYTRNGTRARAHTYATTWTPGARMHVVHDCAQPIPPPLRGDTITHRAPTPAPTEPPY